MEGGLTFEFENSPTVLQVYPHEGSELGGTNIRVMGVHFKRSDLLSCAFSRHEDVDLVVPAFWASSTVLECVTPKHAPGESMLRVTNDKLQYSFIHLNFTFLPSTVLDQLQPSAGPSVGGSKVVIRANFFPSTHDMLCIFGSSEVVATNLNKTAIVCSAPSQEPGVVVLSVSTTSGDSVALNSLNFRYVRTPKILSFTPTSGPVSGNTSVNIFGEGFSGESAVLCKFFDSEISLGVVVNESVVICKTPSARDNQYTPIALTFNGMDYIKNKISFSYYEEIVVDAVTPDHGVEYGNTSIVVSGTNFMNTESIVCKFASHIVKAEWISSYLIRCVTPPYEVGDVELRVSNNGYEFSETTLKFSYRAQMVLESMTPVNGSVLGGALITIKGSNLESYGHTTCQFGEAHFVDAMVVTSGEIKCVSPRMMAGTTIRVYVSNNGLDRSENYFNFTFLEDITTSEPNGARITIFPHRGIMSGGTHIT
jgi:hypothetical protein